MKTELIRDFWNYNYWRNKLILSKASDLQTWQLNVPTTFPSGSFLGTLVHTMGAEMLWYQRLHDGISPSAMPIKTAEYSSLDAIVAKWADVETSWQSWLNELDDKALNETKQYKLMNGNPASDTLWQTLLHVVNHGTQHCAELAQMLTDFGMSPGNIDYLYYLRSK